MYQYKTPGGTFRDLTDFSGIGYKLAEKILRHFSKEDNRDYTDQQICDFIERNPYKLLEVRGIGWKRADAIALSDLGRNKDDPERHFYGNQEILKSSRDSPGVMAIKKFKFERQKLGLLAEENERDGVIYHTGLAWLPEELQAEQDIAEWFAEQPLNASPSDVALEDFSDLNKEQLSAISLALSDISGMALTGGAGTGKTKTTASIAKAALSEGEETLIMTFSGKAAQRSAEAMREDGANFVECSTIHRALGLGDTRRASIELTQKYIVLDEASMIPNWLFAQVLSAMREDAKLILVGDPAQLPPIGYGTPFEDLLAAGIPHVHLVTNYRQANQQSIFHLAEAIRTRNPSAYRKGDGVALHFGGVGDGELLLSCIDPDIPLIEQQVVTWTNQVRETLNDAMQEHFNPSGECVYSYPCFSLGKKNGRWQFSEVRIGDKVLVTENDYTYAVFNGQTGIAKNLARNQDNELCLEIDFGFKVQLLPVTVCEDILRLGFSLTVHKSQGSGFENVIVYQPFPVKHGPTRFFYTSVTRAKNRVSIITGHDEQTFWRNATEPYIKPVSTLSQRIKGLL